MGVAAPILESYPACSTLTESHTLCALLEAMIMSTNKIPINFLEAGVRLSKTVDTHGEVHPYPMAVKNFTSHTEQITTIESFYKAIAKHAEQGHCLLKGNLKYALNNESRKGSTISDDFTHWVCLDFDKVETPDIDYTLRQMGLGDVSYVIQYSTSHKLKDSSMGTVSAHVFMLLEEPIRAPSLKSWLMYLNLNASTTEIFKPKLSNTMFQLSYTLDITACQNDKLIYIAPPTFEPPQKDPLDERIKLCRRSKPRIQSAMIKEPVATVVKAMAHAKINACRKLANLPPRRAAATKWKGGVEVISKPDACEVSEEKDAGEWMRLNINGGDSWAYCYLKANPEIVHDFKTDTNYLMKEFLPNYYRKLMEDKQVKSASPSQEGDLVLAFCEKHTGEYYKGLWNPGTGRLELYRARNESQLRHWYMNHGILVPESFEDWEITYDPRSEWVVEEETHRINVFRPSPYMRLEPREGLTPKDFPEIYRMIRHFLGEEGDDTRISEHFLNWFAVIFQRKDKPITAWVNHGVQGTGKGFFMTRVVRPLLGSQNVAEVGIGNIEDQFNSWQEGKLFINVNEIDVDDFSSKGRVEARFKMLITDKVMPVRRMRQTMSQEPNYGSYLFTSNKVKPVIIPADDRRYNVGNRQTAKLVPPKEEDVANELEAFAQWLLAHRADVALANQIIDTEARHAMQRASRTGIEETLHTIMNGEFEDLWINMVEEDHLARGTSFNENERIYNGLIREIARNIMAGNFRQTISRDEIGIILRRNATSATPLEPNKLTSLLRNHGIETKKVHHKGRKTWGVHVLWKASKDILNEIERELGITKPKLRRAK